MSTTEIIQELPKLSHLERRESLSHLMELEVEQEDMEYCEEAAMLGFQMLDGMEEDAAKA